MVMVHDYHFLSDGSTASDGLLSWRYGRAERTDCQDHLLPFSYRPYPDVYYCPVYAVSGSGVLTWIDIRRLLRLARS